MRFLIQSLLPLAVSVGALSVTEPQKGADIDPSSSFTVKWTSVNTDPSSFDLYIVNNAEYPPVEKLIASNVDTSKGSYTVDSISDLSAGHGYQINLLSDSPQNSGILAQSQQFNVTSSDSSSSTSSTSSSTSTSSTSSSHSSTSGSTTTTTSTSGTLTPTTSGSTTAATTSGASSAASSSAAAGSSSAAANGTSSTSAPSPGAASSLTAPLTVAAGLLMGALVFSL